MTALDLARRLRRLGYQVIAMARNGPQAIQHALSLHPHVVLMDIHLQGTMDGIDAAQHIQAVAPIPVVYMSVHADAATVERLQATTQAAGFVPKPIHLPTLHATLQRVCSRPPGDLPCKPPLPLMRCCSGYQGSAVQPSSRPPLLWWGGNSTLPERHQVA